MSKAPLRAGLGREAPVVHAVVPASPGFYVMSLCWGSGPDRDRVVSWSKTPVIAWLILEDGAALPSAPHLSIADLGDVAVMTPDGEVTQADETWVSVEGWFADAKASAEGNARRPAA